MSEDEIEQFEEAVKSILPDDFSVHGGLTVRRERPSGRGYPLYLQIVEGSVGSEVGFLSPYYVIKGEYMGISIVDECDSFSEAKVKIVEHAHEESYS